MDRRFLYMTVVPSVLGLGVFAAVVLTHDGGGLSWVWLLVGAGEFAADRGDPGVDVLLR